jgi:hypothetical protein
MWKTSTGSIAKNFSMYSMNANLPQADILKTGMSQDVDKAELLSRIKFAGRFHANQIEYNGRTKTRFGVNLSIFKAVFWKFLKLVTLALDDTLFQVFWDCVEGNRGLFEFLLRSQPV